MSIAAVAYMDRHLFAAMGLLVAPACSYLGAGDPPIDPLAEEVDEGCPSIFKQDVFPEYRVSVSQEHWDALVDEFLNREEREAMGLDPNPYHPIELEYEDTRVNDAMIRLRGQSSWLQAIALDANPKMQFVISFNEIDPDGRFYGVRKVVLDMPRTDTTFLRQRLALYALRRAGIPAQCANSARLIINGEYYGLYAHVERFDKELLQRVYGDLDEGDLWKGGRYIETNEDSVSYERIDRLWAARTVDDLESLVDLDAAVSEWAAEAALPHSDGYYMGRANFFVYDHPSRGFIWLPEDLDSAFDFTPATESPLFPTGEGRAPGDRLHWSIVLSDPAWRDRFVEELARARDLYHVSIFEGLIDRWAEQIATAAADDPMKPFPTIEHDLSVQRLRAYFGKRVKTIDAWLKCAQQGGADDDGDGFESCFDCNDDDAAVHQDSAEMCNGIDDNCDGIVDAVPGGETC